MVMVAIAASPGFDAAAQGGDPCQQLVAESVAAAQESCAGVELGQACYGHDGVTAQASGADVVEFAAAGDSVVLSAVESLTTAAADPDAGAWGVAMLGVPGEVEDADPQMVTGVLFGEATITRPAQVQSERPTLTVSNSSSSVINLRNGAGVVYEVVGTLEPGQSVTADGRNEQADWVRIQLEDGTMAWVFVRLIDWEGDFNTLQELDVLLPTDVTPPFQAGEPFQSFVLETGAPGAGMCGAASSGLLLQFPGDAAASVMVNEVSLEFANATVLLHATPDDVLEVMTLAGSGTVTARGIPEDIAEGEAVQVSLGGDDSLTPTVPPVAVGGYAFPKVTNAPVSLLPGKIACMVGLPSATANVTTRVGPGEQRGDLGRMSANASYLVTGWADDPDGAPWWQLDTGDRKSWVPQAAVEVVGACDVVAQVEPPPLVVAPPSAPPAGSDGGGAADSGADDLAPDANTVWQMVPGNDNMTGDCSGAPAINFCDHLAAIAPAQGGITWRGMEASPYYLTRIQPNVYSYSGPNVLGTGTVQMTLRFEGDNKLSMTMSLVLNSEPNCQHVYYYTGTKNW